MVRISFLAVSAVAIVSLFTSSVNACERDCRKYPVQYLVEKYSDILKERVASLPPSVDRTRVAAKTKEVLKKLQGRRGTIDNAIFSTFRSNCEYKPPHRSPDEICGSAKSIACFAPWNHRESVFVKVHTAVVNELKRSFANEKDQRVRRAMVNDVAATCPRKCGSWLQPFQDMMLRWEQREHKDAYGNRVPNCLKGRLGY
ncbi:hypothetical protein BG011_006834 [Mortierella polycephala]|uniref:Uncharacterized protein n=1 Tax=Mortierella polycephala TaxID=41804 RepID=A0A9P6PUC7_9FUNG|nr:hypothetical protein BG011_006834 [Mortierella polycephala]